MQGLCFSCCFCSAFRTAFPGSDPHRRQKRTHEKSFPHVPFILPCIYAGFFMTAYTAFFADPYSAKLYLQAAKYGLEEVLRNDSFDLVRLCPCFAASTSNRELDSSEAVQQAQPGSCPGTCFVSHALGRGPLYLSTARLSRAGCETGCSGSTLFSFSGSLRVRFRCRRRFRCAPACRPETGLFKG